MDTNRIFTNLFGGWLTAADKAAATTINYTKSTVVPCVCDLIHGSRRGGLGNINPRSRTVPR